MFRRVLVALLAFTFAASAWADTRQELHSAFVRNLALKSFRATMRAGLDQHCLDRHAQRQRAAGRNIRQNRR